MPPRLAALAVAALLFGCPSAPGPNDAGELAEPDAGPNAPDAGPADAGPPPHAIDRAAWEGRVLYLAMIDRFRNGDPSNDRLGEADCFDPSSPKLFHGGDFAGLASSLGYLEELGVSALWVTPVSRQIPRRGSSCGYHGYWADLSLPDDGALERAFGTEAELSALITQAQAKDIRFVLDVVVNHAGYGARLVSQRPDWFHPTATCASLGATEVYCPLSGLPDLAQEKAEVADYLDASISSWLSRFAVDGLRMDTAKHVPGRYFKERWIPAVDRARAGTFLVAEAYLEGGVSDLSPFLELGFDSAFHFPLRRRFVDAFAKGGSLEPVAAEVVQTQKVLGQERARLMTLLLDNHDTPRFLEEAGAGVDPDLLRARYHLALTALFTLPGIAQLYQGDELAPLGAFPQNRQEPPAWAFTEAGRQGAKDHFLPDPQRTFALVRRLGQLRQSLGALRHGDYLELWRPGGGPNVWAFLRSDGQSRVVVVMNNGDKGSGPLRIPIAGNGGMAATDKAALSDGTVLSEQVGLGAPAQVTISQGKLGVELPPRSAGVYRP